MLLGPLRLLGLNCYMLVVCTVILSLFFFFCFLPFSSCRAEKYGPVVRLNAFHRVSVVILSPEGVKVLQNKPESTVGISLSLQKEGGGA